MPVDHIALARSRLPHVESTLRPLFETLVQLVEQAAAVLAPLQRLHPPLPLGPDRQASAASLGHFIENEVLGILSGIVADLPRMIPADARWPEDADPSEMHVDAELLVRYLAIARMAANDPAVPAPIRRSLLEADHRLAGWEREMTAALRRIDDRILRPLLTEPSRHARAGHLPFERIDGTPD